MVLLFAGYIYIEKFSYANDALFFFIGWPDELGKPIFKEFVDFTKEGYTKEITASIKYPHRYEFEIYDENKKINKSFKYSGVVKVEFLKRNVIKSTVISEDSYGGSYSFGGDYYESVVIAESPINLRGEVKIRITVVKADPKIKELGSKIFLTMDGAPTN